MIHRQQAAFVLLTRDQKGMQDISASLFFRIEL